MKAEFRVLPADARLDLLDFGVQAHLPALLAAEAAQPLGVEEQDVLVLALRQPDDEIRVVGMVVEEGHALAPAKIADQEQLPAFQAGIAAFGQLRQRLDNPLLVLVQEHGPDGDDARAGGIEQRLVGMPVAHQHAESQARERAFPEIVG